MRLLLAGSNREYFEGILMELRKNYIVDVAYGSSEALHLSEFCCYDSIVMDSSLEDIPALELCKMMRDLHIDYPIIHLFEGEDHPDKVRAYNTGVDVMLSKPVDVGELIAQIKVLARRRADSTNCSGILISGDLRLDMKMKKFFIKGKPINLRRKEYDLLQYLMINCGKIISKEELLEHVWDKGIEIFSNTVEVHVLNIRLKMKEAGSDSVIKTHRGFGYEIEACEKTPKALLS